MGKPETPIKLFFFFFALSKNGIYTYTCVLLYYYLSFSYPSYCLGILVPRSKLVVGLRLHGGGAELGRENAFPKFMSPTEK